MAVWIPPSYMSGPECTAEVLEQEPMLGETLWAQEREEALETPGQITRVLKLPEEPMGCMDRVRHTIDMGDAAPIQHRLWKVPIHCRALVEAELEHMLADQRIEPTNGLWTSPVVLDMWVVQSTPR